MVHNIKSKNNKYYRKLHIVMVNAGRWREIRDDVIESIYEMIPRVSTVKGHALSRGGILPDHIHLTLGCGLEEAPEDVAVSYMNNVAFACDMRPVLQFGGFIGTFGEYDLGAIR